MLITGKIGYVAYRVMVCSKTGYGDGCTIPNINQKQWLVHIMADYYGKQYFNKTV